ncbi:MAG: restriction endonuclease [Bacillota bacterium]
MLKQYSRSKRLFNIGLARLREIRARGRYMRYYISPARSESALAKNIDFYGLLLAASIVVFTIFAHFAGSLSKGLLMTVPLMMPAAYMALKIRKAMEKEAAVHDRTWRAGRICRERIRSISDVEGLNTLVAEILEKIPGYSGVHVLNDSPGKEGDNSVSMAVRALHEGGPVVVGCVIPGDGDSPVPSEKIACILEEIKSSDIKGGILVTSGTFSGEARRAALELKKSVTLADLYRIVDLARETGHEIFPAVCYNGNAEKDKSTLRHKKLIRFALEREKAKSYLYSAGLLLAIYYTAGEAGTFSAGYPAFAVINLLLAMYCIIGNREKDLLGTAGKRT